MKRLAIGLALAALLATPASTFAFHHRDLPARECATNEFASNNPTAVQAIQEHGIANFPLPPLGPPGNSGMTSAPGNGQGDGADHCANAADE